MKKVNHYPFLLKVLNGEIKWFLPELTLLSYLNLLSWNLKKKGNVKEDLPFRVISIGNITWGGTGKTLFAEYLAKFLKNFVKVGIVTTGYKGRKKIGIKENNSSWKEIGDESFLLSKKISDIPIAFGINRRKASFLLYNNFKIDCIILDDAFQYRKINKDIEILLIDSTQPLGNGYLIPRGNLREPYASIERADLVILTKCNSKRRKDRALSFLRKKFSYIPFIEGFHRAKFLRKENNSEILPLSFLKDKKVGLFSGLGDPSYFEEIVSSYGANIEYIMRFPDHYIYKEEDLKGILNFSYNTDLILTTEKDIVKMPQEFKKIPLYSLIIEFAFLEGENILKEKLREIIKK